MSELDTWHTDEPVCPYCGYVERDAWEIDFGPGIEGVCEIDCGSCDKTFEVSRNCSISYTTKEIPAPMLDRLAECV